MRSIIKAAVRVIILIMFVMLLKFIMYSAQSIMMAPALGIDIDLLFYTSSILGPFIIGTLVLYFLWRKTDWIVRIIAGNLNDNELVIKTSNLDLLKVAMRLFGIYLLIASIPDLFGLLTYYIRMNNELMYTAHVQATTLRSSVSNIITIGIGVWLVIGTRGIAKVIDNIMDAPISKVPKE